tara:strand:+ start:179 stop:391 length:213 start_codon:yes stop_codon:yes gene_type:complete
MAKKIYESRKHLNNVSCKIEKQTRTELMIALHLIRIKRKNSGFDYSFLDKILDIPQEDWIHPVDNSKKNI